MRMLVVLAVAVVIVASGFGVKTVFIRRSVDDMSSITTAMATSVTLSPHEIHLNYKNMRELPVEEIKYPF
jgi:hypothetical protein